MKQIFPLLVVLFLSGCGLTHKDSWIPPSPMHEVSIREIPAYNAIDAQLSGSIEKIWTKGYRQDARYLSMVGTPLQFPILIVVPDWDQNPPQPEEQFNVQLMLKYQQDYASPREKGQTLVNIPTIMVACYAWEGPYTYQNFLIGLNKVRKELARRNIPSVGAPRILLYSNPDWTLKNWCIGEVQVPVPEKINPD